MNAFPHRPCRLIETAGGPHGFAQTQLHPGPDPIAFGEALDPFEGRHALASHEDPHPSAIHVFDTLYRHLVRCHIQTHLIIDDARIGREVALEDDRTFN